VDELWTVVSHDVVLPIRRQGSLVRSLWLVTKPRPHAYVTLPFVNVSIFVSARIRKSDKNKTTRAIQSIPHCWEHNSLTMRGILQE
jgi:hypothetical protein